MVENPLSNARDAGYIGSFPGLGGSCGGGNGNPIQYSCMKNPVDRGAWWIIVHGDPKNRTQLSD